VQNDFCNNIFLEVADKIRTLLVPLGFLRRTARWHGCQQYKDYVLVLLFVKYVSDRYAAARR
jgi:type I restriction-modification system DNA methylase subunit